MSNSFIQIHQDGSGKKVDNSLLTIGGEQVYRQRTEVYAGEDLPVFGPVTDEELRATPLVVSGSVDTGLVQGLTDTQLRTINVQVTANGSFGDITVDAWGIPKVSIAHSLFHGLFTFDVPVSQWMLFHGATQVYTSTNIKSTQSAGEVTANAAQPLVTLQGRDCPRYQPNRGHLLSTALWCPNKTNNGLREWGVATTENGAFFRLKADGLLYVVVRSGNTEIGEALVDTSLIVGFDVQKGNVYDIQYQWRGVGNYKFYVNLKLVAVFNFLGSLTALSMQNPALPAYYKSTKTTQDVSMFIGCVDISSENGNNDRLQPRVAYANISRNGTDVPVISIHNPLLINGQTNTRTIYPTRIGFSCDKKAIFKIFRHRDPGLLTGETFVTLGTGSFVQTDSPDTVATAVAATAITITTMELISVVNVQANGAAEWNSPDARIDFDLVRGDYLTITATTVNGLCDISLCWGEAI